MSRSWERLHGEVIDAGNCQHCGACVGLNPNLLTIEETDRGPLPVSGREPAAADEAGLRVAWAICPGRGVPYPELFESLGREVSNWLLGPFESIHIGHATDESVRRRGASGGVISATLIRLLETGAIDGAAVLQQGRETPEAATPFIATSREEILAAAQSVYAVTPTLTILPQIEAFDGKLALVGLPEQITAIRLLQAAGHAGARKVVFTAGPYTGTNMYRGSVRAFLRARGVRDSTGIRAFEWRAGEWPGYLRIETVDGREFKAEKFYYNYLIPFFISRNCLITPDFTNEAADLSVGDAWSPVYERAGGGYSVVIARSAMADELLRTMEASGALKLKPAEPTEAVAMHAHMIEFKKRGSAIRLEPARRRGKPVPEYGYRPDATPWNRRAVEKVIGLIFAAGRQGWARWMVERIPLAIVGPFFNTLRKSWKSLSKPVKRRGMNELSFTIEKNPSRWVEITHALKKP